MSVDSGLCTVARLLTGIQERANHSFALGMYALNSNSLAKSVVSKFWCSPRVASPRNFARARVCILPAPQSRSPKLETTHSLLQGQHTPVQSISINNIFKNPQNFYLVTCLKLTVYCTDRGPVA